MVDLFKQAWDVVKKDYVAWLVLYGVFFLVVSATMGLGGCALAQRAARDAPGCA